MKIIPMNESHVAQVAVLEKICFSDPWSENSVASELSNPLSLWLIAEENDVVCLAQGSMTALEPYLNQFDKPVYTSLRIGVEYLKKVLYETVSAK